MSGSYYDEMRRLARSIREQYGLTGPRTTRSHLRSIYKDQEIFLDYRDGKFNKLKGAYLASPSPSVMVNKNLPEEPLIFTLAHELKHHLVDRDRGLVWCDERDDVMEIGAEVFASELVFPQDMFKDLLDEMGVAGGRCTPHDLVVLKRNTRTTMSYHALTKHAMRLGFASDGAFDGVKWRQLEEQTFGVPIHKQISQRRRLSARMFARVPADESA